VEKIMAKTLVVVDDDALAAAMVYYGTSTKVETINLALRDAAARHAAVADEFITLAVATGEALADVDMRREAWR
jgi:Arc/MetJ family transcription regulator